MISAPRKNPISGMSAAARFDPELWRHYDEFALRYSTYPSSAHFCSSFGEKELVEQARLSNGELIPRPVAISVKLPFCCDPCLPQGCEGNVGLSGRSGNRYVERLLRELERMAELFDRDREVVQIHFAGATPDFLRSGRLAELFRSLDRNFYLSKDPERDFSLEMKSRSVDAEDIAAVAELGFNRASFSGQACPAGDPLGSPRQQSFEQTASAIEACRMTRLASVTVKLIYGQIGQSVAGFTALLDTVIAEKPDRLSLCGYAEIRHLCQANGPSTMHALPDRRQRLELLGLAINRLTEAGYIHIGMDCFALPDDRIAVEQRAGRLHRNCLGYTTHADCEVIGFGVGAVSHVGRSYCLNEPTIMRWETACDDGRLPVSLGMRLTPDDEMRGRIIEDILCRDCVDVAAVEDRYGIVFTSYFAPELKRLASLAAEGLLSIDGGAVRVTSRGRYLSRIIASYFDRYQIKQQIGTGDD